MTTLYKALAYRRGKGKMGGSCAIIYNEAKFKVEEVNTLKENVPFSVTVKRVTELVFLLPCLHETGHFNS